MLETQTVFAHEGLTIAAVACRHEAGAGAAERHEGQHAIVFVRRGCFVRSVSGREAVIDPTVAYCINPGDEHRYDHPQAHGDDCTVFSIGGSLVEELADGSGRLPSVPRATPAAVDLEHRVLLARAARGACEHELFERALGLVAAQLAHPREVSAGSSVAATAARRRLAAAAREALATDPDWTLTSLASEVAVSPYHLSRSFRSATGHTLARHRVRLRVRRALHALAGGERDLARLAPELGFTDQSYMCRVIRAETGSTPRALRRALATDRA